MQNQLGLLQTSAAAPDALDFNFVAPFTQTNRISEDHRQAADIGGFFDRVAGGPRDGRHNRAIMAEQLVEKTGFSRVWPANDRDPNAAPENLPFVRRAQQFIHALNAILEPVNELLPSVRRYVFIREVNVRLDMRQRLEHFIPEPVNPGREIARELLVGGAQGQLGPRMD